MNVEESQLNRDGSLHMERTTLSKILALRHVVSMEEIYIAIITDLQRPRVLRQQ